MGSVSFTAPDSAGFMKGATLNAGVIQSVGGSLLVNPAVGFSGTSSFYVGATVPTPLNALKVGFAWDYLDLHNAHAVLFGANPPGNSDSSAMVVGLYANYQANDKLSFNARVERVEDNNAGFTPGSSEVDEVTLTAQYQLWANVLSRVEFRWDNSGPQGINGAAYDSSPFPHGTPGKPYGTPIKNDAFLLALNLIYQF